MSITTEQAQEIITNVYRVLGGWKEQKKIFSDAYVKDRTNKVAQHTNLLITACIDELQTALGNTALPSQWKTELLAELTQVIEKYDGK